MNLFRAAMHPVSFCTSLMQMGSFHVADGGDLLGVGFDVAMANDEAE
jgi:hypothetical protein